MTAFAPEQLATLLAVLEGGSFEAAATRLHVTPSAVSQRIRALETAAGQVLVRRVVPVAATTAGERFARFARQVELLEQDLRADLDLPGPTGLPVAVNADSIATWFLTAIDRAGVVVAVQRADQERSADLLRAGAVVAAVTSATAVVQGCTAEVIGAIRYRAVAAPAFAERWIAASGAGGLAEAPAVDFDSDDAMQRDWVRAHAGREPTSPRYRVPEVDGITRAVEAGLGWSLVPAPLADPAIAAGRLVDLAPGRTAGTLLRWQRWAVPSRALDALTSAVREVAADRLADP